MSVASLAYTYDICRTPPNNESLILNLNYFLTTHQQILFSHHFQVNKKRGNIIITYFFYPIHTINFFRLNTRKKQIKTQKAFSLSLHLYDYLSKQLNVNIRSQTGIINFID